MQVIFVRHLLLKIRISLFYDVRTIFGKIKGALLAIFWHVKTSTFLDHRKPILSELSSARYVN